jgi:FtsP/CotA-like multicopper oxidase with cupredoxin domain
MGGVHQIIKSNETWTAAYTVKQQACTNWYHPHLMGKTAQHVMKGLAGMIIIDDDQSEVLDLPKRYGIDDIPLIIQDRRFNTDGSFDYNPSNRDKMHGWKGDTFLVNGTITPYLDLEAKQIRFRILNGSNSRIYTFALASGKSFQQIATDNSFLETPVTLNQLRLSPAERAEIIIDFSTSLGQTELLIDKSSDKALFKINISKPATVTTKLPQTLVKRLLLNADDAVNTRSFSLSGRAGNLTINGLTMNKEVINESIPLNAIEVWEVNNMMDMDHNFHIHATHFQIIERNGSSATVAENEKGFKDTVFIPANESVKLIIKMIDYTDSKSPYMYHCHILEHEDLGMMGQFVVV